MRYTYTKAYSQYGASMGRPDHIAEAETVAKIHLERIVLNTGGYDLGGAYWGHGAPLYVAWGDGAEEVQEMFLRASDREEAKEIVRGVFKNAKFYR